MRAAVVIGCVIGIAIYARVRQRRRQRESHSRAANSARSSQDRSQASRRRESTSPIVSDFKGEPIPSVSALSGTMSMPITDAAHSRSLPSHTTDGLLHDLMSIRLISWLMVQDASA